MTKCQWCSREATMTTSATLPVCDNHGILDIIETAAGDTEWAGAIARDAVEGLHEAGFEIIRRQ